VPKYTDMVKRPRSLDDTIADLMGGNFTHSVVQHAVAELKRLGEIRRGIELVRVDRAVTQAELVTPQVKQMVQSQISHEIAAHIAGLAKFSDQPTAHNTRTFRAEAMIVKSHLYDAVVPPLPKTTPYN
jgi:hypothetical protein